MSIDTTIPLWGLIVGFFSILFFGLVPLLKMWRDLQEQKNQIRKLSDDQGAIRQLIEDKNEKTLAEIKKLEQAFMMQKEFLVEIKTLVNLILSNRIRHEE